MSPRWRRKYERCRSSRFLNNCLRINELPNQQSRPRCTGCSWGTIPVWAESRTWSKNWSHQRRKDMGKAEHTAHWTADVQKVVQVVISKNPSNPNSKMERCWKVGHTAFWPYQSVKLCRIPKLRMDEKTIDGQPLRFPPSRNSTQVKLDEILSSTSHEIVVVNRLTWRPSIWNGIITNHSFL